MQIREFTHGSDDYRAACALRQAVLRAPLGLDLFTEDLAAERDQWHFGLCDDAGTLVACAIALPLSSTRAKIRQMAVHPAHQRHGCGRQLLTAVQAILARRGFTEVTLHARRSVEDFYARLGYTATGAPFTEVGLPHIRMERPLP